MNRLTLFLILPLTCAALPPLEVMSPRDLVNAHNEWNRRGLPITTTAGTGSMRPYLWGKETLLCERYDGQALSVGMLIVFARWDTPSGVVHEVIDVNPRNGWFKCRGLNCAFDDGWLPPQRCKMIVRRVLVNRERREWLGQPLTWNR